MPVEEAIQQYARTWEKSAAQSLPAEIAATEAGAAQLAQILRGCGIPAQSYQLLREQVAELSFPFLISINSQWAMGVPLGGNEIELAGQEDRLSSTNLPPNPVLVAEPPVGIPFVLRDSVHFRESTRETSDIAIFYTATNAEASLAKQVLGDLEKLIERARKDGKEIVFLDSLGLIPPETVRMFGEGERGFDRAIGGLKRELMQMEKGGIPARDSRNPIWNTIYPFLQEHGVPAELEDLKFEFWRWSLAFDKKRLMPRALDHFIAGQLGEAAELMAKHQAGFHRLNCTIRNRNFVSQIREIATQHSSPVLFLILREIGHYGVLERMLPSNEFFVQTKILGEARFATLLKILGINETFNNIGVSLEKEEIRLLGLRACLKALLLPRIAVGKSLAQAASVLDECQIDHLDWETIAALIDELHAPSRVFLRNEPYDQTLQEQLLYLLNAEQVVPDKLIRDSVDAVPTGGAKNDTKDTTKKKA
jgi:hypothetical protein